MNKQDRAEAAEWLLAKARDLYSSALEAESKLARQHLKSIADGDLRLADAYVVSPGFVQAMRQIREWRSAADILQNGGLTKAEEN